MNERFEKRTLSSGNSMSDISQCHSSGAAATKQIQFQYFPLIQIAMLSVSFPLHIAQGLRACWGWRFMYLYCIVLLLEYRKDRSENHVPRRLYLCVWLIGVQWSRVCYHCLNKRRFFPLEQHCKGYPIYGNALGSTYRKFFFSYISVQDNSVLWKF